MQSTSTNEIRSFLLACNQILKEGRATGWPQIALAIGAHPTQLEELRQGDRTDISPAWISGLVSRFGANPNFLYYSEGTPLLTVKTASK